MTHQLYPRWPPLEQYRVDTRIEAHWPFEYDDEFCIAPWVNMRRVDGQLIWPQGESYSFPRQLRFNRHDGWEYDSVLVQPDETPWAITNHSQVFRRDNKLIYQLVFRVLAEFGFQFARGELEVEIYDFSTGPLSPSPWKTAHLINMTVPVFGQFETWSMTPVSCWHLDDDPP